VALEALFVQRGLLDKGNVRLFRNSMEMRENADYLGVFSREGAILSVSEATRFIEAANHALERSSF
jgi:uncharacterized protein (UPF0332 family)